MNPYAQAALLGVVQGLTEFLPVSSSGHLILFGADEKSGGLLGVMVLHAASLLALAVVFRRDILALFLPRPAWRTLGLLAAATLPVGVIGLLFESRIDAMFAQRDAGALAVVGCGLIATGIALALSDLFGPKEAAGAMRPWKALVMGLAQAVAILPGVSRSGSTISSGLATHMPRAEAVRWSFLLALPAVGGATLLKVVKAVKLGEVAPWGPLGVGFAICFIVSFLALRVLMAAVKRRRFWYFALYTIPAGGVAMAMAFAKS
ncbi:MAG: undecaprenyl-diphosphate phosphatase [Planctomycetes bacterium]|nr:undecaprenyl-diphosphate phosphatase [Planctomycetota bacterium]